MRDLAIVVPVRDEAGALGGVLAGLPRDAEVIVVDDGSTDGSAEIARAHGARVIAHPFGRGYGAALKTGIEATDKKRIAIIDGDGSYDPRDVERLAAEHNEGEMIVGARARDPSTARRTVKTFFRYLVRATTGAKIPDLNSGLRVFDRALALELRPVLPDRFSFTTTITLRAHNLGVPVRFTPIAFGPRVGRSKFEWHDLFRFSLTVFRCIDLARWRYAGMLIAAIVLGTCLIDAPLATMAKPILLGAAIYPLFVLPKVIRWRGLLARAGSPIPFGVAFRAYITGLAFGAVTPGRIGELARIAAARDAGASTATLTITTVVDRLLDVAMLALAASAFAARALSDGSITAVALAVAGAGLFSSLVIVYFAKPPRSLLHPAAIAWSAISIGLLLLVAALMLEAAGARASFFSLAGAASLGNLAALVPVTVAGLGTRETAIAGAVGADASAVAAYALGFHAVFTGMPWLLYLLGARKTRCE